MTIQRVLQVHTWYRHAGGEDQVVEGERRLLEAAGIEVRQVRFDNAEIREHASSLGDARLALDAIWSRSARERVADALRDFPADVVHVHNTFAAASPSVYAAANEAGVPVVQTVHNYRLVCPAATAFRQGRACTDCVGLPIAIPAVVHRCVRQSRAQSVATASLLLAHRVAGTWRRRVDAWITLTGFQRDLVVEGGVPERRITVLPNFLDPDTGVGTTDRSGFLYAGRLSPEKGVSVLLGAAAMSPGLIRVAGSGPMAGLVSEAAAAGAITLLGQLDSAGVQAAIRSAVAVVVPSTCFEGFPVVVAEAYAAGTPVIASDLGSLREIVVDGVTGRLCPPGSAADLAELVRWAEAHPEELAAFGRNARARFVERYSGAAHLRGLLAVYGSARAQQQVRGSSVARA